MPTTETLNLNSELWLARVKREIAERQTSGNPAYPPVGPAEPRLTGEQRCLLANGSYMGLAA